MNALAYEQITRRVITLLEQGTVPWQRPWKATNGWPRNLITKKPYRGINVFMLVPMAYESPFWLTFRQAVQLGGGVTKGEKASPVVFWKRRKVKDKESGQEKIIPLLRFYHVFNVAQCDGIGEVPQPKSADTAASCKPEEIVANMPKRPQLKHGMTYAFYSPKEDFVGMPSKERFDRTEDYFSALFHELVHSTGHESRLKRPGICEQDGFGSDPYCKEELVAEMGAAFLCAQSEIVDRTVEHSAAYLQGWLKRLRDEKSLLVQAAAQAQKAVDFILGKEPDISGSRDIAPDSEKVGQMNQDHP